MLLKEAITFLEDDSLTAKVACRVDREAAKVLGTYKQVGNDTKSNECASIRDVGKYSISSKNPE